MPDETEPGPARFDFRGESQFGHPCPDLPNYDGIPSPRTALGFARTGNYPASGELYERLSRCQREGRRFESVRPLFSETPLKPLHFALSGVSLKRVPFFCDSHYPEIIAKS